MCKNYSSVQKIDWIVGTGMVGMSFAYAALNQNVCDELIMIDLNEKRAEGEAMDLNHGLAFSHSSMKIRCGGYGECADADIVVICAGANQKPTESRLQLLQKNAVVFSSIVPKVVQSGFEGIFLVAWINLKIFAEKISEPFRVKGSSRADNF